MFENIDNKKEYELNYSWKLHINEKYQDLSVDHFVDMLSKGFSYEMDEDQVKWCMNVYVNNELENEYYIDFSIVDDKIIPLIKNGIKEGILENDEVIIPDNDMEKC